jgi:immunity protein, SdpI family
MKNIFLVLSLVLAIGAFAVSFFLYPQLPDRIPTHWNFAGKADDFSSRNWGAFLLPAITLGLVGLFRILPRISPKHFEVENFRRTYEYLMFLVIALLVYIHCFALFAALKGSPEIPKLLLAGIFLFFAFLGNVLGKVRRNFWIGCALHGRLPVKKYGTTRIDWQPGFSFSQAC